MAWDKGLTLFKGSRFHVTLPFKADTGDWDKLTNAYNEYSGVNPGSYSKSFDPYGWSKDSYNIGVSAYKDMHEGVPILQQQAYITKYEPKIREQIVRGGHRLARALMDIYFEPTLTTDATLLN